MKKTRVTSKSQRRQALVDLEAAAAKAETAAEKLEIARRRIKLARDWELSEEARQRRRQAKTASAPAPEQQPAATGKIRTISFEHANGALYIGVDPDNIPAGLLDPQNGWRRLPSSLSEAEAMRRADQGAAQSSDLEARRALAAQTKTRQREDDTDNNHSF